ncbi:septum formation initiator [Pedobacter yulinensis]|uniref:Septum formation initiator n=1 Tax=Pedobacter yulinensis TaxID=2126353 RepID=A0A2T3HJ51_9SPHI|nr:septum formation initiator [Pedobacter yulinensis]
MRKMVSLLRNKYFLATLIFAVWMLFFDRNDIVSQYEYGRQVDKLQEEKDFYEKEIMQVKKDLRELDTDLQTAEKYARERYFMKKDNEDVFVIIRENKKED